ncbi:MAG TPA: hypothetical protein VLM37_11425 [Fibrobacteraceae bacterium]|nr:hypothetical protein [Fibrobacteraceae bacterium]
MSAGPGGALAVADNASSITGNPAAVKQPRRITGELGAGGVGGDLGLFSAWTFPAGQESVLGISWVEPDPGSWNRHRLGLSGSSRLFQGTWLGVQGTLQKIPDDTRLDLGVGGYHRLNARLRLGWVAQNLTESLDTLDCDACDTRHFGLGAAWFTSREERLGLFIDGRLDGFEVKNFKELTPIAGMRLVFGADRNLQALVALRRENLRHGRAMASAGVVFQHYFFSTLVNVHYALNQITVRGSGGDSPLHQLSVGLIWDAFSDRLDPRPFLRSTQALISPDGVDHLPGNTDFLMRVDEESGKLDRWSLVIYTATSTLDPANLVRRFQGEGFPPRSIRWSGEDPIGNACLPGIYAIRLIVSDAAGNQAWTRWQFVEIR